jgi:serine protease Do
MCGVPALWQEVDMNRPSSRLGLGVLAIVLILALYYGLRYEPSGLKNDATHNGPRVAAVPAPTPQDSTPARAQAAASTTSHDLTPNAAAQAPAVPNFVDLVKAVKPAVVSVRVKSDVSPQISSDAGANPFEGTPFEPYFRPFTPPGNPRGQEGQGVPHRYMQAQGSGFFISADGDIVTNNHVVANAVQLQVVMDDGMVLDAKVTGTDPKTDIALLKVEGQNAFPFVTLEDELPKTGEWIIAMGNPFGLGGTVTAGIVSAQGRDIGSGLIDFLQIDAAVNRGNSGGPTFNMRGRVIGVNTAIYSPSGGSVGIAFDIPATTVKPLIAQLKERGYVERGWIGVQVQPVTGEIADSLGMEEREGALVSGTQPDSPAAKAGLKVGDVIKSLNGAKVKDPRDLARQVADMAPNTNVEIGFLRNGKQEKAQVTITQLQDQTTHKRDTTPQTGGLPQSGHLGIAIAPAARVMGIGEQGVAVIRVDPSGKGAEAGLRPGDVILQMGGKDVSSPDDVMRTLEAATAQKKQHVLALVRRNDREMFVALSTG